MRVLCYSYVKRIARLQRRWLSDGFEKLKPPWNILFFGTDNFSLASLEMLCRERDGLINNMEVVTNRKNSSVRKFAESQRLQVHDWPLVDVPSQFHVGVVVSFGHLIPERVIEAFPMGMLNVHASLLPRWRGAAPIIYAIANGDTKTGVSIMRVRPKHFDVGEVVDREEVEIPADVRMPELHDRLAVVGASRLVRSLRGLPRCLSTAQPQSDRGVTYAPKVSSTFANVDFATHTAKQVYDRSRALSGLLPLVAEWNGVQVKLHNVSAYCEKYPTVPGLATYDKQKKAVTVDCKEGCVLIDKFGIANKKVMNAAEFNNGYLTKLSPELRLFKTIV